MRRRLALAAALAFLSGWADVVCLVRYSAFAGMQTGNAVMVGRDLADDEHGADEALYHLTIMGSNLLGVMLYEVVSHTVPLRRSLWLLAVVAGLATGASDVLAALAGPSKWYVCFAAASFGAQNALSTSEAVLGVSTTIMTGNLQKIGAALTRRILRMPVPEKQARGSKLGAVVLAATVLGAMVAALALRTAGARQWPCFLPIALLQALSIGLLVTAAEPAAHDEQRLRTAGGDSLEAVDEGAAAQPEVEATTRQ